jgi:ELWxxDGT repeat protein
MAGIAGVGGTGPTEGDGAETALHTVLLLGASPGQRLHGADAADTLAGGSGNDTLDGHRGDDVIEAGGERDIASGGSGNDTLRGGAGRDTLFGHAGDDLLEGGEGVLIGGAARDNGWGVDMAGYAGSAAGVAVDLATGTGRGGDAEGDRLLHIAHLRGSAFADTLAGDTARNRLEGGAGDDRISGRSGADTLLGGAGDDSLEGGTGEDVAVYAGRLADHEIIFGEDGSFATVRDRTGAEGADSLRGIERVRFADATVEGAVPEEERIFFVFAGDAPGSNGPVLWASDGTAEGTRIVKDFMPGREWSAVNNITPLREGGWLLWANDPGHGPEPWLTDGTSAGTRLLADSVPGTRGSYPFGVADLGNGLLSFTAYTAARGSEPWVTDLTPEGTRRLVDIAVGAESSRPSTVVVLEPGIGVFTASEAGGPLALFVTDGTAAGTRKLLAEAGQTGNWGAGPTALGNGLAVFARADAAHGGELWVTDGTEGGTGLVRDIRPGPAASDIDSLSALGDGRAVFRATTATAGQEVWVTDGTAAGTRMIVDLVPGPGDGRVWNLRPIGEGKAMFLAWEGAESDLYLTDGTRAGTVKVPIAGAGVRLGLGSASLGDGRVVFALSDDAHGMELWITDGTAEGTRLVKDINPSRSTYWAEDSWPGGFAAAGGGKVVFEADDGVHGPEPWITDGTPEGTVMLAELVPGPWHSAPGGFAGGWGL